MRDHEYLCASLIRIVSPPEQILSDVGIQQMSTGEAHPSSNFDVLNRFSVQLRLRALSSAFPLHTSVLQTLQGYSQPPAFCFSRYWGLNEQERCSYTGVPALLLTFWWKIQVSGYLLESAPASTAVFRTTCMADSTSKHCWGIHVKDLAQLEWEVRQTLIMCLSIGSYTEIRLLC